MEAEVLRQGDDGKRCALVKGLLEGAGHLAGTPPPEPFVVLDIATRRLVVRQYYNDKIFWSTWITAKIAIGEISPKNCNPNLL